MNSLLKTLLCDDTKSLLGKASGELAISPTQLDSLLDALGPTLGPKLQSSIASGDLLSSLLGSIDLGVFSSFMDSPDALASDSARDAGRGLWDTLFGDHSNDVVSSLSEKSGIAVSSLNSFLPMVVTAFVSKISKGGSLGALLQSGQGSGTPMGAGFLTSLLDQDGDGAIADDLLNIAKKML